MSADFLKQRVVAKRLVQFLIPPLWLRVRSFWREGLSMMRVGGKARFIVPAALGYGAMGTDDGRVPPDAMISFDVELLRVESMS
jgi:FKBP-type peptidyl-prolyl cis-trans isomerase